MRMKPDGAGPACNERWLERLGLDFLGCFPVTFVLLGLQRKVAVTVLSQILLLVDVLVEHFVNLIRS